ncbi:hypothetical protein FQN54_006280 [Arachnomyces sp. PD_36]|nr:hypothetical protein FQN54_006280 [Arachnomyces sp. PD_36]
MRSNSSEQSLWRKELVNGSRDGFEKRSSGKQGFLPDPTQLNWEMAGEKGIKKKSLTPFSCFRLPGGAIFAQERGPFGGQGDESREAGGDSDKKTRHSQNREGEEWAWPTRFLGLTPHPPHQTGAKGSDSKGLRRMEVIDEINHKIGRSKPPNFSKMLPWSRVRLHFQGEFSSDRNRTENLEQAKFSLTCPNNGFGRGLVNN